MSVEVICRDCGGIFYVNEKTYRKGFYLDEVCSFCSEYNDMLSDEKQEEDYYKDKKIKGER